MKKLALILVGLGALSCTNAKLVDYNTTRLNHIEEEKKVVVKVFYKEKYVDSFSYEYIKDNFYLRKEKVNKNRKVKIK